MAGKRFDFLNNDETITPVLKQILEYIKSALPAKVNADNTLFKAKIIITELLTNALKHSHSKNTIIDVKITNKILTITKTNYSDPLALIAKTNASRHTVAITKDMLHTLYAKFTAKDQLQFIYEENNIDDTSSINDIIEHFGLLIITKAADIFVYTYDHHLRSNTFVVTIEY
ncbi:hypothetical protein SAMN05216490_2019 [Mucilaginibacter mallensis]|uniref:Histidine kinase-like ATPase domain-containing protein n=1 Tax=Mucilaginibacter mallensis TaxID=652787 RepID=A0A1H1VUU1_MUCMA|nr:hypothetical protein [Mucilaginibacter mallensis]SDS88684.1 hypothetical protein SAMN05216490_2019 [Mucilaginibacter mallensis]